jgi:membrane protein required for colicin V production
MMILHAVDYTIIAVVGLSVLTGLFRGFVKELIALFVWVIAIWLGFEYSSTLAPHLKPYIDDTTIRTAASFILILLATLLIGAIINALFSFVLHRTGLSGTDRLLGMIFGFVRGVFIVALVIVVINMTSLSKENYAQQSVLYAQFDPLVRWLSTLVPNFIEHAKKLDKEGNGHDEKNTSSNTTLKPE